MPTRLCDRCRQTIEDGALRFVTKIQVYAAYDPLHVTFEELTADHSDEIPMEPLQGSGSLSRAHPGRRCACPGLYSGTPLGFGSRRDAGTPSPGVGGRSACGRSPRQPWTTRGVFCWPTSLRPT